MELLKSAEFCIQQNWIQIMNLRQTRRKVIGLFHGIEEC